MASDQRWKNHDQLQKEVREILHGVIEQKDDEENVHDMRGRRRRDESRLKAITRFIRFVNTTVLQQFH
jgi:hypothetical protein